MGRRGLRRDGLDGIVPMRLQDLDPAIDRVTGTIIDAAIAVQRALGNRLLGKPYERALAHELQLRGHRVRCQVPVDVRHRDLRIPNAHFVDLPIDEQLVVEPKASEDIAPRHLAQLATYLRFEGHRVGLLVNFHAMPLKLGIKRVVVDP